MQHGLGLGGWAFPALLLSAAVAAQPSRPLPPPESAMGAFAHPGWIVDAVSGCWIWNPNPRPGEKVTWSGPCPGGPASGRGVMVMRGPEGTDRHEGEMRDGRPHGRGESLAANGERYSGEFRAGLRHGTGILVWGRGGALRYEGGFVEGRREGQGVFTTADGGRYQGAWRRDLTDGQGVYTWPNGDRYEGTFERGPQQGEGVFTAADGSRYAGRWRAGRAHGPGTDVSATGVARQGEWRDGCLLGQPGPPATGSRVPEGCR